LLQEAALIVRNNPSNRYVISGYSGPTKMEKQRSADQVATVVNYLVEKEGINPERLTVRSGLQGGTSNSVKIRVAADGEVQEVYTAPSTKKVTY